MTFLNKASYLAATHQAKSFADAIAKLKKIATVKPSPIVQRLPYVDN
jgi:hypothetical protein